MDLSRSYPWDIMHLFFENIIPNLVKLWSGKFKGLDVGDEDYELSAEVWEEIWEETAAATKDIPASFARSLAAGPSKFTAEAWCFWFVYMAPALLKDRFSDPKYHKHACELSEIIKASLQFVIPYKQMDELEVQIINWVEDYERFYYQYRADRLSVCLVVVHGMLHVVPDMRFCGPSWTTYTFYMERYCGFLKAGLRSKVHPWANLNNRILNYSYLEQLGVRYDLADELEVFGRRKRGLGEFDKIYPHYPHTILQVPCRKTNVPDDPLRRRIAGYFASVLAKPLNTFLPFLPKIMISWGKVRIVDGDRIRSASASRSGRNPERNSSYVRYEVQVKVSERVGGRAETRWRMQVCYGRLEEILVCQLPQGTRWGSFSGETRLLAVITPCVTEGKDATQEIVSYQCMTASIVTDIETVLAVVGRVESRGKWTIIDRSGGVVKPEFVPSVDLVDDHLLEMARQ
ncbi:hypothetical protein C8R46DRAFT_23318 [Mycena filopes]|nr:hypothetical protein C8R46DRAFT_23318 [Mycena filopes]